MEQMKVFLGLPLVFKIYIYNMKLSSNTEILYLSKNTKKPDLRHWKRAYPRLDSSVRCVLDNFYVKVVQSVTKLHHSVNSLLIWHRSLLRELRKFFYITYSALKFEIISIKHNNFKSFHVIRKNEPFNYSDTIRL
jgi:hypothetical protein